MAVRQFFLDMAEHSGDDTSSGSDDHEYSSISPSDENYFDFINDESEDDYERPPFPLSHLRQSQIWGRSSSHSDLPSSLSPPSQEALLISSSPARAASSQPVTPPSTPQIIQIPSSTSSASQPKKPFQLQSKKVFLTYSQCDYPPERLFENLKQRFPDAGNNILVAREQHEDGNYHLHCLIDLKEKLKTRRVNFFDDLVDPPKHPNIQSRIKSKPKTIAYIVKGGDPSLIFSNFDYQKFLKLSKDKKATKSIQIAQLVAEGKTLDEIDDEHPDYVLLHGRILREYIVFRSLKERRQAFQENQLRKLVVWPAPEHLTSWNDRIAVWLSNNIRQPRVHRQKQLWISAPPSAGKTSLITWLESTFGLSVYFWPRDEKWFDGYSDGAYDLIVLDEFRSQKKITELNPILSGDPTPLSRRSAPPLVKRDILPVIILSNFTPEECFHKVHQSQLDPLIDRLIVVQVPANGLLRFVEAPVPEQDESQSVDPIDN